MMYVCSCAVRSPVTRITVMYSQMQIAVTSMLNRKPARTPIATTAKVKNM